MKLLASLVVTFCVTSSMVMSQLVSPYLPKDCQASATTAATQVAPDAMLVAIATFSAKVPVATATIEVGMNLTDGKSAAWAYVFHSAAKDTFIISPFIRLFGSCAPISLPAGSLPGGVGPGDVGLKEVPANYLQGTALLTALGKDGDYAAYHTAHPDSLPSFSVMSSSVDSVLDFPAGTPFWTLIWQGSGGLTCFVHAETGQTICSAIPITTSVTEQLLSNTVVISPNPAHDVAAISVPLDWVGRSVEIDVIDAMGSTVNASSVASATPVMVMGTTTLTNGSYMIRLRTQNTVVLQRLVIVK